MANKTIGQLTQMTPSSTTKLAVYDDTTQTTGNATVSDLLNTENLVYADDAMSPGSTAELDFESQDQLNPSSTVNVTKLEGTDGWSQRFVKVSQMFKNIRWLFSKLGNISMGTTATTITGAIAEHEQDISGLNNKLKPTTMQRPLSEDQKTAWSYTAPHTGLLYLGFIGTTRAYCAISWNHAYIGSVAMAQSSIPLTQTTTVYVKKGDVIEVSGLSADCYLSSGLTALVAMGAD